MGRYNKLMNENGTMITGPAIDAFRLATLIRSLEFEVRTGMKMTRISALKVAQRDYGVAAKTKAGAIAELKQKYPDFA